MFKKQIVLSRCIYILFILLFFKKPKKLIVIFSLKLIINPPNLICLCTVKIRLKLNFLQFTYTKEGFNHWLLERKLVSTIVKLKSLPLYGKSDRDTLRHKNFTINTSLNDLKKIKSLLIILKLFTCYTNTLSDWSIEACVIRTISVCR